MNQLAVLTEKEILSKQFKIYGTSEEPLFLAKDVAEWIENKDVSSMLRSVDDDEKILRIISGESSAGNPNKWFLTESGLYEVLMQSRKPVAKQFKKQVKEILKDIRKHGMYATDDVIDHILQDPDFGIKLLSDLKVEREQRKQLELQNAQKEQIINELKPKADYTDLVLKSKSLLTTTQISKDYGMSGTEMNKLLHKLRVQYKQSGQWLLYTPYQKSGYTSSETINIKHKDGSKGTVMHTKWTQKGRLMIYNLLKKQGVLPLIECKN